MNFYGNLLRSQLMKILSNELSCCVCGSRRQSRFYKKIENYFKAGYKLQFAIDINFLKEKYLKGYLQVN